jgi:hypothetical protein
MLIKMKSFVQSPMLSPQVTVRADHALGFAARSRSECDNAGMLIIQILSGHRIRTPGQKFFGRDPMLDVSNARHSHAPELTQASRKKGFRLYRLENMLQSIKRHPGFDEDSGDPGTSKRQDTTIEEMAEIDEEKDLITRFQTFALENAADFLRELVQVPETAAAGSWQPKGGLIFFRMNLQVDE